MKDAKNSTVGNSSNYYYPYQDHWTQPGTYADCPHRLPCGICIKTNTMCPLNPGLSRPTWINTNGTGGSCNE